MSVLRWTQEQFDRHMMRAGADALERAIKAAPTPVGPILDAKSVRAKAMLDAVATAKPAKYRNKTTVDERGVKHASKKQAARWRELGLLMKSGEILMLAREVRFRLPGGVEYHADHVYANQKAIDVMAELVVSGDLVVEDVKSEPTKNNRAYRIKAKQMAACLGIPVKEIS